MADLVSTWVGATAKQIARAVRRGDVSATSVVAGHLDQLSITDPSLEAFRVVRAGEAITEAEKVDDQEDLANLPLAGVPVAVKENTAVAGLPTWSGSAAVRSAVAEEDHEVVRRLRGAGAVVVGVTRMPEMGLWAVTDDQDGATRNPWNIDHTPGGSSGGSAAAVAAGLVCGGPAALTMLAAPGLRVVAVLQFVVVAMVMSAVGLAGQVRAGLDRIAFLQDERLRADRAALLLAAEALPRRRERHRMIALSEEEFRELTRRALEDFGDVGRLLRNPLVDLPTVDRRLQARGPGVANQPLVRVAELRAVLAEQVNRLKPAGAAAGVTDEWRFYNALHYCCVLGLRPYDRAPQTDGMDRDARRALDWFRRYVPRRSLRRWKTEGAELVAARLWRDLVTTDPRWLSRAATGTPPDAAH